MESVATEVSSTPEVLDDYNINVALIGCGAYARSCYLNYFKNHRYPDINLSACVDLRSEEEVVGRHLDQFSPEDRPIGYFLDGDDSSDEELDTFLADIRDRHAINAVILSTPPNQRLRYISWALRNGLHILSDKPLTATPNCSVDPDAATKVFEDYGSIAEQYRDSIASHPNLVFDLMVQRRFHPVFQLMLDKINEVAAYTGCPLTHFQSTHADGQWRLPSEIIDIDYHGFSDGTGKTSHSGYHFFDFISTAIRGSLRAAGKSVDEVSVYSQPTFPRDYIEMINFDDYRRVLGASFDRVNRHSPEEYSDITEGYGEIDCVSNVAFKHGGRTLSSGTINLLHNSFSGRYWADPNLEDLYRSNGRLRQELHFLVQGPFQSIVLSSLRGCSKVPVSKRLAEDSMREPLQVEVFRNTGINPAWKAYERFTIEGLIPELENPDAHLGWARNKCITTFLENIAFRVPREERVSDLLDHELSTDIFSGVCESIARATVVNRGIDCG